MSVFSTTLSSGEKLFIRFEHKMARFYHNGVVTPSGTNDADGKSMKVGEKVVYQVRRATLCTIYADLGRDKKTNIRMEKILAGEWTACHPKDQFTRSKGRKSSLAKALKKLVLSADQRRDIWYQYFTSVKDNPLIGDAEYDAWRSGGNMTEKMHAEGATEETTPIVEPTTTEETTPAEGDVTPGQATADVHGDVLGI